MMYFVLWFYLYVVGDVSLILHHEGILNEYTIVQTVGKPVILDPYLTFIKFDTKMEINFRFWILQDLFDIIMTDKHSKICIISRTPEEFQTKLKKIKNSGAIIYQYKSASNTHTSLLFKIKHNLSSSEYYNFDCVLGLNLKDNGNFATHNIKDNDELIKFIGVNYGLLLFNDYPKPLIFTRLEAYDEIVYSKFYNFVGGTIRNIILVILLLTILVVIVIVIHNNYFKSNHIVDKYKAKNI